MSINYLNKINSYIKLDITDDNYKATICLKAQNADQTKSVILKIAPDPKRVEILSTTKEVVAANP